MKKIKWYGYAGFIPDIVFYQVVTKSVLAAVTAGLSFAAGQIVWSTGRSAITTGDLPYLMRTWQGWIVLLMGLLVLVIYTIFDINAMVLLADRTLHNRKKSIWKIIREAFANIRSYRSIRGLLIILFAAFAVPLIGAGTGLSLTSSFYIPNFITSVIQENILYRILYYGGLAVLALVAFFYAFVFQYMILQKKSAKASMKEARKLMQSHWKDFLKRYLVFLVKVLIVLAILVAIVGVLALILILCNSSAYRSIAIFLGIIALIAGTVFTLLFIPFHTVEMNRDFELFTGARTETTEKATANIIGKNMENSAAGIMEGNAEKTIPDITEETTGKAKATVAEEAAEKAITTVAEEAAEKAMTTVAEEAAEKAKTTVAEEKAEKDIATVTKEITGKGAAEMSGENPPGRSFSARRRRWWVALFAALAVTCVVSAIASYYLGKHFDTFFPKIDQTDIVAHRAGGNLAAENTVAGLNAAVEAGAEGGEIDVQRTLDGYYVINHDDTFFRLCGVNREVSQMTMEEIRQLKIRDYNNWTAPATNVASLEDMLNAAKGKIHLYVELKGDTADEKMADDVYQMVQEQDMLKEVTFICLDYSEIDYLETRHPEADTGYLCYASFGDLEDLHCDQLILEEETATADNIERIHDAGKKVSVWTVDSLSGMLRFMAREADGIITNKVNTAIRTRDDLHGTRNQVADDLIRIVARIAFVYW